METRKWPIIAALFYPFAIATMSAGLLAFMMIMLKLNVLFIATVVLWFYFASAASIYSISKGILKVLGVHRFFLSLTVVMGLLAVLSALTLGFSGFPTVS